MSIEVKHVRTRCRVFSLLVAGTILFSCGYRYTGGGVFQSDAETLFVNIFENRTSTIGLELSLSRELSNEITSRGKQNALVGSLENADAILSGEINSIRISTASLRTESVSATRRVEITVQAWLTNPSGRLIWRSGPVSASQSYDVAENNQVTEDNKRVAIDRVANQIAEALYNRMTQRF